MSANTDNKGITFEEQLSNLESHLEIHANDETMLGDVGMAMRTLLSDNGETESQIRQMLERQFEQGKLRQESYELVERLLGKIASEERAAAPKAVVADEPFTRTDVIERPDEHVVPVTVTEKLQVGSVLRDRFLLKEQIAEGSMGTVYKALDRRLAESGDKNTSVAIKVLSPRLSQNSATLRALQQEAAKGRCLAHPNIVTFIDLDHEDDLFFIVMEWLEGRSLSTILDENRGNSLDMATAMDIVRQTARALSYAHQRGVVHADVKPGNIMITPDGQVKLIDFGVARVRQKENEGRARFDPDAIRAGSPAYSSMQVLTGEDPVPADDVFSLACLMYRLVAGYRVFGPRNAADAAQEGMEPQQPREVSTEQWMALKKALAYSRVTRFESTKAFMDALGDVPAAPAVDFELPIEPAPTPTPAPAPIQAPPQPPVPVAAPVPIQEAIPAPIPVQDALSIAQDETTQIAMDSPMRAERDPIMFDEEEEPRRSSLRLFVIGIIIVAAAAVVLKPELIETLNLQGPIDTVSRFVDDLTAETIEAETADGIQAVAPLPEADVVEPAANGVNDNVVEELVIDVEEGTVNEALVPDEFIADVADEEPEADQLPPPIDFSVLPDPTLLLSIDTPAGGALPTGKIEIREDGAIAIVDLVRGGDLADPFTVQFVEVEFAGNQSSWESGQYKVENYGLLVFEVGQPRARISISMRSNPVREPDREVRLSVRDAANPQAALAMINLTLEDDDQRAFEAGLPADTVGFTVNQISVREFDPAVQVDIIRYKPSNTALEIDYTLTDVTATEGQDYFSPSITQVYFGPGQRTARILIPLGQDARPEQDEAFMLELEAPPAPADSNIFSQIAVMIRDDDS